MMPESELKQSISELKNVISILSENTSRLDTRIEVFIQKSEGESEAFKKFMDRQDRVISKHSSEIHALQIWKAEASTNHEDIKEVKRVVVRWIAGGLVASASGIMAVILAYFKVNMG